MAATAARATKGPFADWTSRRGQLQFHAAVAVWCRGPCGSALGQQPLPPASFVRLAGRRQRLAGSEKAYRTLDARQEKERMKDGDRCRYSVLAKIWCCTDNNALILPPHTPPSRGCSTKKYGHLPQAEGDPKPCPPAAATTPGAQHPSHPQVRRLLNAPYTGLSYSTRSKHQPFISKVDHAPGAVVRR